MFDVHPEADPPVAVATDELLRQVIRRAGRRRGLRVAAEVTDYGSLLSACARLTRPVAVAADQLAGEAVEDVLDGLVEAGARVVVVSADRSPERMNSLLARNVAGYFSYQAAPDELVSGVLAAARGEISLNAEVATTVVGEWRRLLADPVPTPRLLTVRELDVLNAMADGMATKTIAARLGVAYKTVENHKLHIFAKLGARNHAHAVTLAMSRRLTAARPPDPADATDHVAREGSARPR